MDVKDILELAEKLAELPVKEIQWGDLRLVFDTGAEPSADSEDEGDDLEPVEEIDEETLKYWSARQ